MGKSEDKNSSYLSPICCGETNVVESKIDPQRAAKSAQNQRRRWIFHRRDKYRDKRETLMVDRGEQYDEQDIQPDSVNNNCSETDKTELLQR